MGGINIILEFRRIYGGAITEEIEFWLSSFAGPSTTIASYNYSPSGITWVRYTDDGSNTYWSKSADGVNFIHLHDEAKNSRLTPDQIGIFVDPAQTTAMTTMTLLSWKFS